MNHPGCSGERSELAFQRPDDKAQPFKLLRPIFNTTPDKRPEMEFALGHLVRRRLVEADGKAAGNCPPRDLSNQKLYEQTKDDQPTFA